MADRPGWGACDLCGELLPPGTLDAHRTTCELLANNMQHCLAQSQLTPQCHPSPTHISQQYPSSAPATLHDRLDDNHTRENTQNLQNVNQQNRLTPSKTSSKPCHSPSVAPHVAPHARKRPPLWSMAAGPMSPSAVAAAAFKKYIPPSTCREDTPERLRCVSCGFFVMLEYGAVYDDECSLHCMRCAACAQLLAQDEAGQEISESDSARGASTNTAATANTMMQGCVERDLRAVCVRLERHLSGCGTFSTKLCQEIEGGDSPSTAIYRMAVRECVNCIDEAQRFCREISDGSTKDGDVQREVMRVIDRVISTCKTEVPSSLIYLIRFHALRHKIPDSLPVLRQLFEKKARLSMELGGGLERLR